MKKLCLLSGMMLLGASMLNAMQSSQELQQAIVSRGLVASKDLKDFTKLVHVLADQFGVSTEEVAQMCGTSVSKKYIELGRNLLNAAYWPSWTVDNMVDWIKEGADVNFTSNNLGEDQVMFPVSPLKAVIMQHKEINKVDKLLEYKADPTFNGDARGIQLDGGTMFDVFVRSSLEKARKK